MTQESPESSSASQMDTLLKAPGLVIAQLKDEPILLGGMGAGALVAIIAVFVPDTAQIYAWIIAGLMLTLCLLKAAIDLRGGGRADETPPESNGPSIGFRLGDESEIEDTDVEAEQTITVDGGRKTKIKGAKFRAGAFQPPPSTTRENEKSGQDS
jgi:hypothetical protein